MMLNSAEMLISHIKDLIEIQKLLKNIRECDSLDEKKSILSQYKDDENLRNVIKYTYSPNIDYGDNVKESILDLSQTDTLDDVYSVWYMLDKLASNNTNPLVKQEFKDYMSFFPDIEELITSIITKDLNLGININSINKIVKNLDLSKKSDSNKNNVIDFFKYK